jgi:hypothetical protein
MSSAFRFRFNYKFRKCQWPNAMENEIDERFQKKNGTINFDLISID